MAEKRAKSTRRSAAAATARKQSGKRPAGKQVGTAKAAAVRAVGKTAQAGKIAQAGKAGKTAKTAKKAAKPAAGRPKTAAAPRAQLLQVVSAALDEMKAVNVRRLDVRKLTDIADTMVIVSGNSDRHVRSIADRVVEDAKKAGFRPTGVEGERDGEWVLVDLQDVIVHIMLPRVREFYRLESLWDVSAARREAVGA